MEISDVRVKLIEEPNDRLKAVCSITLDGAFVIRDMKIVEGTSGLFVAMPSRKLTSHCPRCRSKNHLRARFCNECGSKLPPMRNGGEADGRTKLHRDIAHPITTEFRELVQERVIQAFHTEVELAKQPGYAPRDMEAESEESALREQEQQDQHQDQAQVFDRPVEPEPEDEPTEYDALIAGLDRGDGGRSGGQRRPQPQAQYSQRPQQSQPPRRSDDRGRRGGERRDDRGQGQAKGRGQDRGPSQERGQERGRPRPARPAPAPSSSEQPQPRPARPEPRPERRSEPPRPPAAPSVPAAVPAADDTDDTPFGAGL